jgi:site-specific recombinase XerD
MASVQKNPKSPFWIAFIKEWKPLQDHPSGGFFKRTAKSTKIPVTSPKKEAMRVADELERIACDVKGAPQMSRGIFEKRVESLLRAAGVDVPLKATTWKEFSAQYLDESEAGANSLKKYRGEVKKFSDFLGARASRDLREVAHKDVAAFYKGIKDDGLTSGTARATTKTVKAILERAKLLGYLESNPAALVKMETGNAVTDSTREPFEIAEVRRLMSGFLKTDGKEVKPLEGEERMHFLFGLTYGLRASDAASRRHEEIFREGDIRVIEFIPQKKKRGGKTIRLPLVGELATLIPEGGKGFITPGLAKKRHPSRWFEDAMEKAEIDRKTIKGKGKGRATSAKTFHSLRHTASSWLMQSGADQRMRQLICDHDDPRMNAKYTHASVIEIGKALEKSTALLGDGKTP